MANTAEGSAEHDFKSKVNASFKKDLIKDVLKTKFSNSKTKINDDSIELIAEIAKALVIEAALRATKQASIHNVKTVALDHVEIILPQLMLDLP